MSKILPLVLAMLCSLAAIPQAFTSGQEEKARHYFFTHFTTSSGLVSYQVNSSVQDEDGYIWIATNDGLQRFDGVRFKTFRHNENDSSSLPSNLIFQLLIDNDKNLWLLTIDGKAGIFNTKTFRFKQVSIHVRNEPFLVTNAPLKKLIKDEFGNVYLSIPGSEVVTYKKSGAGFSFLNNFRALNDHLKINGMAQQPGTHKYWLCTEDLGLSVYNDATGKLSYAGNNIENERPVDLLNGNGRALNIYFDKKGRLWTINTNADTPSVSCYDTRSQQLLINKFQFSTRSLGFHQIRSFFEQKDGTIWIIGQKIFARFLEKEKTFEQVYNGYEEEHGIDFLTITSLMEDRENSVWVSTANNGMFRYNPSKEFFTNIRYVSHTTDLQGGGGPVSFMPDRDGGILVGIREDGLYRFNKNLEQVPLNIKGIPDKNTTVIWDMCASADSNTIWMAAENGIYKYDQAAKTAQFLHAPALSNRTIRRIAEDSQGNLWLGTIQGGVFKWDATIGKTVFEKGLSTFSEIPPVRINSIKTDRNGKLWIATNVEGAYLIDPVTGVVEKHFSPRGKDQLKLAEQSVLSLLDYSDSLMILGTSTRLVVYNRITGSSHPLGAQLSGFNASIEKDQDGHLWVSTTTSIYRVTVSNKVFLLMNRNDGLSNDYFLLGASRLLPDGRMLFGVYGSTVAFLPTAVNTGPMFPDLKITGFAVKDRSLLVDSLMQQKIIILDPEDNSLTIDLSVLSYNSGYLLKSKLEGLDMDWKVVNQNYQLVYSYLPPGRYTLYVQTLDADGVKGEKTIRLAIRIKAPFYKTGWFYSLIALLLTLLLYLFDRQRTSRKGAIEEMRSNIAGNLHREVNTTLNNINILSEMAKLKADNNPEKSKEFIGQINIKSESMINAMDDMLWSIDPANDSMVKFIERLREFIEKLNSRDGSAIELLVDRNAERMRIAMQLRHEALVLFKEYTQHQVQFGARNIIIQLAYEKSNLVYSSNFDPDSCNMKLLTSFLYSNEMEKRLKTINAKMRLDTNKSNVVLVLKLPV